MASARKRNVVLIGMPGVGKSTIGVLLAKALSWDFLDADVLIQAREGRRLQDIIDHDGLEAFRALEKTHMMALSCTATVLATGGSVVYSEEAMTHLRECGTIVWLELSLASLKSRIADMDTRGIVMAPGQTFDALYAERQRLYQRYADITVDCENMTHEATVAAVAQALRNDE